MSGRVASSGWAPLPRRCPGRAPSKLQSNARRRRPACAKRLVARRQASALTCTTPSDHGARGGTRTAEHRGARRTVGERARPGGSPDGRSIAFRRRVPAGFDIWTSPAARRSNASTAGDERWPSWTRDGRVMFPRARPKVPGACSSSTPMARALTRVTGDDTAEWQGAVSPDGKPSHLRSTDGRRCGRHHLGRELPAPGTSATKPPTG